MANRLRNGFTLIELLVVIVIIGMIAAIAVPSYNKVRIKARETEVVKNLSTINQALNQFAVDHNGLFPYRVHNVDPSGNVLASSDLPGFFPLGLFGGVEVVDENGVLNAEYIRRSFIQPRFQDFDYYQVFNQYTDPLVALGYLSRYPRNPFFPRENRPVGSTLWAFSPDDLTIPSPDVVISPGDFVYTFNMGDPLDTGGGAGSVNPSGDREDPKGVIPLAVSYRVTISNVTTLDFKIDLVDSYQLWAYGSLPLNGPVWTIYTNNNFAPAQKRSVPRKDFNGNGYKDEFEQGVIAYYSSGGKFYEKTTSTGEKIEF